jgi:hypothetical protein
MTYIDLHILKSFHRIRQIIRSEVGIDHSRLNVGMAHWSFNSGQVNTAHYQMTCESMREGVDLGQVFNPRPACDFDQLHSEPVV